MPFLSAGAFEACRRPHRRGWSDCTPRVRLREAGILVTAFTERRVRFVVHLDVDDPDIEATAQAVATVLA